MMAAERSADAETTVEPILLSGPDVGPLEEAALLRALRSGWVAPAGPELAAFEAEVAARVGAAHAVALSSGTAALHLGLMSLGVGPGDLVLTATMTFAATANAIVYTGAEPYFVDADPATGNLDPALLEAALEGLAAAGERVGAIVPVDLFGKAADYTEIERIGREFEVPVLADAAESLGAAHRGRPAGSLGRAAILSFNGNKIATTSGGGMLLSDDEAIIARARYLSTQAREPVPHYEHLEIGFNYRLSNLLAALGRAQLARLDELIAKRRLIREGYREAFASTPGVSLLGGDDDAEDNCWLTSIIVDEERANWRARDLRHELQRHGIESRPLWKPMHLQPVFAHSRGTIMGAAQRLFETGLTLPSGSAMSAAQRERVLTRIREFLAATTPHPARHAARHRARHRAQEAMS